jgi:FMN phosphatase YigB (HAD superfamily)
MRVAFDLDDTLIPTTILFSCGVRDANFPFNLFSKEPLRHGAADLLRRISRSHELWIYTTSLRNPLLIKLWLRGYGVKIHRVINADAHYQRVKGTAYEGFSKAPRLFGIDLLVDDSLGVARECEAQGVRCILLSHADDNWAEKVTREMPL